VLATTVLLGAGGALAFGAVAAVAFNRASSAQRAARLSLRSAISWSSWAPGQGARPPSPPAEASPATAAAPSRSPGAVVGALAALAGRLSPSSYGANTERRLELAGKSRPIDTARFLALRLVTLALVVPGAVAIASSPLGGIYALGAFIAFVAVLGLGPEALLNHLVSLRKERLRADLPAAIELLMISVEAGLSFDQALQRATTSMPGPLSEEFSRYLGEVRIGASHREALEAMDRRTGVAELRSFLTALSQAEGFGISVGAILRSQAHEARVAERQRVQERAQKAPLKMLVPLVFCVLPALFVVVLGPAVIEIYRTLLK